MEYWIPWFHEKTDGDDVKLIAQTAESLGFTGVALSDHIALPKEQVARHPVLKQPYDPLQPNIEPFTVAATMAAVTKGLRFMTYSLVAGMRDPFSIARQSASMAGLTSNRFTLGITPGWLTDEMQLLGHDPKTRGKRFDEALQVIRGLWENDLFSYEGEYYNFRDVAVCPRPAIAPQIMIGGNSPKSYERARHFDGWIGMTMSVEEVTEVANTVRQGGAGKKIYMIPPEPLSDVYLQQLQAAGVDGLVYMLWMPGAPGAASAEAKCELMQNFARRWIKP